MSGVDIVMTSYNCEKFIGKQIESIFAQTYKNWHLIISDDHSTDSTLAIAQKYQRHTPDKITIIDNEKNSGVGANFQIGLSLTTAPLIAVCDVDDVWLPQKLSTQVEFMDGHPDVILCHHDLKIVDEKLEVTHDSFWRYLRGDEIKEKVVNETRLSDIIERNYVAGPAIMFREKLKGHLISIEGSRIAQDYWIALNATALGRVMAIPEQLLLYRQRQSSLQGAEKRTAKFYISNLFSRSFLTKYRKEISVFRDALEMVGIATRKRENKAIVDHRIAQLDAMINFLNPSSPRKKFSAIPKLVRESIAAKTFYARVNLYYILLSGLFPVRK